MVGLVCCYLLSAGWPMPVAALECPVTIPNGDSLPVGYGRPPSNDGAAAGEGGRLHGNGLIWSWLPEDGVYVATGPQLRDDGSIEVKWYWWRRNLTPRAGDASFAGDLRISGTRLDMVSSDLDGRVHPSNTGTFQGSRIAFSAPGCWEILGTTGDTSLRFTVLILSANSDSPDTALPSDQSFTAGANLVFTILGVALASMAIRAARPRLLTLRQTRHPPTIGVEALPPVPTGSHDGPALIRTPVHERPLRQLRRVDARAAERRVGSGGGSG